jgi:hypothetical protein
MIRLLLAVVAGLVRTSSGGDGAAPHSKHGAEAAGGDN